MNKGVLCKFQQTKGSVQENFAEQMAPGESYKPISWPASESVHQQGAG